VTRPVSATALHDPSASHCGNSPWHAESQIVGRLRSSLERMPHAVAVESAVTRDRLKIQTVRASHVPPRDPIGPALGLLALRI
jgi:hypothetical protein